MSSVETRSPASLMENLVTGVLAVVGAAAVNAAALAPAWVDHPWYLAVHVLMSGSLVAAGMVLNLDPSQRRTGLTLVVAGYCQVLPVLAWQEHGPFPWLSWVFGPVAFLPIAMALLAFPLDRLRTRRQRTWVVAAAIWLPIGRVALGMFSTDQAGWWPEAIHHPALRSALGAVYNAGGVALCVYYVVLLVRRWQTRTAGLDRYVDAPVAVAAAGVGVTAGAHLIAFILGGESRGGWPALVGDAALATVPLAFLAVAVARRLLYTSVAGALRDLPPVATPSDVRSALSLALKDPDLKVFYWLDGGYVDESGRHVLGDAPPRRLNVEVASSQDDSPLAMVQVDSATNRHPDVLASALRLGGLALENTRLQAALLAQLREVEESRTRIVEAALEARRQLERDLHDGAQQRLVALAATLGRLHYQAYDDASRAGTDVARQQLRAALADLRSLAHGIHPALLSGGGLRPALADVSRGLPIQVDLRVADRRWPPNVESTAYYVVCEAVTNAAKHAGTSAASVSVRDEHGTLALSVRDDGPGGADLQGGSGLRGLHDRVEALGGHLLVISPRGAGTRIEVRLPCE